MQRDARAYEPGRGRGRGHHVGRKPDAADPRLRRRNRCLGARKAAIPRRRPSTPTPSRPTASGGWASSAAYYGYDKRWPEAFVCPKKLEGTPATVVREGTLAEAGMKPGADKAIDALLTEWAGDTDEAFAVCVVRHGVVVLQKAYGMRDGRPMTLETRAGTPPSASSCPGTLMMTFVDQGLVKLDDPVGAYLPAFDGVTTNKPLTIRRLYNHTDGLDDHWGNEANDMEERMAALAPYLEVGKFYRYNGTGLELGAKVMEAVSGQSLPNIYKAHLLDPLGCDNTDVGSGSFDAGSVPLDMANIGQMLLNKGAYGDMRFMSEETFEKMLPLPIKDQVEQPTPEEYGVGSSWAIPTIDAQGLRPRRRILRHLHRRPHARHGDRHDEKRRRTNFQRYNQRSSTPSAPTSPTPRRGIDGGQIDARQHEPCIVPRSGAARAALLPVSEVV